MYVKWQDVGCRVNEELGVCGQVIRGAVARSGGSTLREEEGVCVHTNNQKHMGSV